MSRWSSGAAALPAGIALLAFVERLVPVLRGGGLYGYGRYDDGVYFTAADALVHGRVPYRDFLLLHPPAIMLVLAPFAVLGRWLGDPQGQAAARVAFMLLGAANAALVAVIARRWGRSAALVAGGVYAVWHAAVYTEQTTFLEPVGTALVLLAILLLVRRDDAPSMRAAGLAGALLGTATTEKIWYVAVWLAVAAWLLVRRSPRQALLATAAGSAAIAVVAGPFFLLAPRRMWDEVVRDQLRRSGTAVSRVTRVPSMLGVRGVVPHHHPRVVVAVAVVVLAVLAVAVVGCVTDRAARLLLLVLAVDAAVLLDSPTYYAHYAALTAAPAALVAGVGLARTGLTRPRVGVPATAALLALAGVTGVAGLAGRADRPVDGGRLDAAAPPGCIAADDPQMLIQMNRLSSDLADGCQVPGDVSGITYDRLRRVHPDGRPLARAANQAYQHFLDGYLTSGSAFVIARRGTELSPTTVAALQRFPEVARSNSVVLRRVR